MELHSLENRHPLVHLFSALPWVQSVTAVSLSRTVSCPWRVRTKTFLPFNLQCLYMTGTNYTHSKNPNTQMENNSRYTMFTVHQALF